MSFFAEVEGNDAAWKAAEQVGESRFGSRDDLMVSQHGADGAGSVREAAFADPLELCGFDRALESFELLKETCIRDDYDNLFYYFRKWP